MNKYVVLFFIFFLIMYAYMMMEPRQFSREPRLISVGYDQNSRNFSAGYDNHNTYKKIYIERDESNNDYRELMARNTDDFEKTYHANLL